MKLNDISSKEIYESEKKGKDHFVVDIETETIKNKDFRRVLYTSKNEQLVVMSIDAGEDAGLETHEKITQFIRIEAGKGKVIFNGKEFPIKDGSAFIVPKGTEHNIVNTSKDEDLKLYTVYSPPNHIKDTVHKTRKDAMEDDEHFDGKTDVD